MKKLMTMLAAVATAFGLYAADPVNYGTSFEEQTAGTSIFDAETEGAKWFQGAVAPDKALVTDYASAGITPIEGNQRPDQFKSETVLNFLDVKTTLGNPIARTLDTAWNLDDGNFYSDTLVRFTNFEDAPENIDGKIAVWVQEIDNGDNTITTNLMVTALGADDAAENFVVAENWETSLADGWARVTIKAIPSIVDGSAKPGFVVWINREPVGCAAAKAAIDARQLALTNIAAKYNTLGQLFYSMVQSGENKSKINAVAFDGQGQIDDVSLTSVAPTFAADPLFFSITAGDANVESITVDGAAYNFGDPLELTANPQDFTIVPTYASGFIDGVWTATEGATADVANHKFTVTAGGAVGTVVAKAALVKIGEKSYGSLAEALEDTDALKAAAGQVEIAGALTLDSTVTVPAVEGVDAVIIDLAGNTITYEGAGYAFAAVGPLTITDSTETPGKIVSANGVVTSAANLTIDEDVTLDGPVAITAGTGAISAGIFESTFTSEATGIVTGGKFKNEPSENDLATGYTAPYDEASGYYIVGIGTYTITYFDEEGVEIQGLTPSTYTYNQEELILPDGPVVTGKNFKEWQNDDYTKFVYVKGQTGPIEVYAAYEAATYTIKFFDKDDQQIGDAQTVAYNEMPKAPEAPEVTGMSFKGWDPEVAAATQDQDYKATYTANVYTVTFNSNGGSEVVPQSVEYNQKATKPTDPTKENYEFKGWFTDNETFENAWTFETDVVTADTTLFAKWESAGPVIPEPEDLPDDERTAYNDWYTKNPADPGDTALNDPDDLKDAYLLGCKAGEDALEAARKEFKFASIEFVDDEWVATIKNSTGDNHEFYGNGKIKMGRYSDVTCETPDEDGNFFKAELDYKSAE